MAPLLSCPAPQNDYQSAHVARLAEAFARVTGRDLIGEYALDPGQLGKSAWSGDFALLSHRGDEQATLNYGNRFALDLWECGWEQFVSMPSAATAPPQGQGARDDLMERVARDNFVSGYHGLRISAKGRLFTIRDVTIWRLLDAGGHPFGMAASFRRASSYS